jgi:hypothetical protein
MKACLKLNEIRVEPNGSRETFLRVIGSLILAALIGTGSLQIKQGNDLAFIKSELGHIKLNDVRDHNRISALQLEISNLKEKVLTHQAQGYENAHSGLKNGK